jgi:hypothetical protein
MIHAGVPPTLVAQVSGPENVTSVMNYATANIEQHRFMSDILQSSNLVCLRLDY